jgi:hypothetical protein
MWLFAPLLQIGWAGPATTTYALAVFRLFSAGDYIGYACEHLAKVSQHHSIVLPLCFCPF